MKNFEYNIQLFKLISFTIKNILKNLNQDIFSFKDCEKLLHNALNHDLIVSSRLNHEITPLLHSHYQKIALELKFWNSAFTKKTIMQYIDFLIESEKFWQQETKKQRKKLIRFTSDKLQ